MYFEKDPYSIVGLKKTRQGREETEKGSIRMNKKQKKQILAFCAAALIGLSAFMQPMSLTAEAGDAGEGIDRLEFNCPELNAPRLGDPVPSQFTVQAADGKTDVGQAADTFLSWRKKQPDGSWGYASNDGNFTEGEYRLRFDIQELKTSAGYYFQENT